MRIKWLLILVAAVALTASSCAVNPVPTPASGESDEFTAEDASRAGDAAVRADAGPTDNGAGGTDTTSGADTSAAADSGEQGDASGLEDVAVDPDTTAPDTTAPDTAAPDTAAPDTAAPDTAAPDTAAPDTAGAPDASPPFVFTSLQIVAKPDPCGSSKPCGDTWTLFFDGSVEVDKKGKASKTTVSTADLLAVQEILKSSAFQKGIKTGFNCGKPPIHVTIELTLKLSGASDSQYVTSCAINGPPGNPAKELYKLITKY